MKMMLLAFPVDPLYLTLDQIACHQAQQLREHVTAMEKLGWEIDVFTLLSSPDLAMEEAMGMRSRLIRLPLSIRGLRGNDLFLHMPELLEKVRVWTKSHEVTYQIIHSNYWLSGWVGRHLQQEWQIPHIHTPYALGATHVSDLTLDRHAPLGRRIIEETKILSSADAVITTSPEQRDVIWRRYGLRSVDVHIIPCGVNRDIFSQSTSTIERKRGRRVVLYTGGFEVPGGLRRLAEVLQQLLAEKPRLGRTIDIWVVGNPPTEDMLKQGDARQLEDLAHILAYRQFVTFLGVPEAEKMVEYYRAADICVVPAADQGLGVAALEAMASGCPVIAPRSNWLRHMVLDGETGMLIPPEDSRMLAVSLERLLGNATLRKRMGVRAEAWVQENFSWANIAKRWDALYKEALHSPCRLASMKKRAKVKIG